MMCEALRTVPKTCFDNFVIRYLILQSLVEPRVPVCGLKVLYQPDVLYSIASVVFGFFNSKMILLVEQSLSMRISFLLL